MAAAFLLILQIGLSGPIFPLEARQPDSVRVDSLIGLTADISRSWDERLGLARKAARDDRSGRGMHAVARIYLERRGLRWRTETERWIERALEREPDSPDYLATQSEVLWKRRNRPLSYQVARRALEEDPNHVEALYWAGRYAVWSWETAQYTNEDAPGRTRVGQESAVTGKTLTYREYAPIDPSVGIDLLSRALALSPDHRPCLLLLGLFYHEIGEPGRLVALFTAHLERQPDDPDAYFFKGLGHQTQGDLESAYRAYVQGMARLDPHARRFVQSVYMMQDEDEIQDRSELPLGEDIERFWRGKDPLFLSPVNERLMEHARRVAYASLKYGDPTRGITGWETDRGQVYIRYGKPKTRQMAAADVDLGLDRLPEEVDPRIAQGGTPHTYTPRLETWGYEDFTVTFQMTTSWDSWRFRKAWNGRHLLRLEDLTDWLPEFYQHPLVYALDHQTAQFRAPGDSTRLEVYYALPAARTDHRAAGPGMRELKLRKGLFLFDAEWDTLRWDVVTLNAMPWVDDPRSDGGYLLWGERLVLEPGICRLAVEAKDQESKLAGTFRDSLVLRSFAADTLTVSDILLARQIVEREDPPFGRDRYMVLPNPLGRCPRGGQAWFYFEIYNLARDAFGETDYRVSYQMRRLPEAPGPDDPVPDWTTAVSYTYQRTRDWEPHHLSLDLADTAPGRWAFWVVVVDLKVESESVASTRFRVTW